MISNPEVQYQVALARLADMRAEMAREQVAEAARRAAPHFVPANRLRDTAFWASLVGPVIGLGFVAYFVQEIGRTIS